MKKRFTPLLICLLALTACTTLHDAIFERESRLAPLQSAILGRTTRDEIIQQLGFPQEINQRRFDHIDSEVFFYLDESASDDYPGRLGYKFLVCEFRKGVLTGYAYRGSFDAHSKDFQEQQRSKLVKGRTSRREVETSMGVPSGRALLPTTINVTALALNMAGGSFPVAGIPEGTQELWWYYGQNFDDRFDKISQESLSMFFDGQGVFVGSALLRETVSVSR